LLFISISATKPGGQIKNLIAQALVDRIVSAAKEGAKFKVRAVPVRLLFG
jgi:phospholipase D1/2